MEKQDLRIRRTKKALNEALLILMERKSFSRITIQELANEAMINRATFYLHYYDIYDLLDACIRDNMNHTMLKHIKTIRHIEDGVFYTEIFQEVVTKILKSVESNEYFFRVMFQSDCDKQLEAYLIQFGHATVMPQIERSFQKGTSKKYKNITLQLIVSTILRVISWWLTAEEREAPEKIAELIVGVVTQGPAYTIGLEID